MPTPLNSMTPRLFRSAGFLAAALCLTSISQAHFVWVSLRGLEKPELVAHFSEGRFDNTHAGLGEALARAEYRDASGVVALGQNGTGLSSEVPAGTELAGASLTYGLFKRGGPPALLLYDAKAATTLEAAGRKFGLETEIFAKREGAELCLTVFHRGAPEPGSEVIVIQSGRHGTDTLETNEKGELRIPFPKTPAFSARAKVARDVTGEHDGEEYQRVLRYSTLCVERLFEVAMPAGTGYEAWVRLNEADLRRERAAANVYGMKGQASASIGGRQVAMDYVFLGGQLEIFEAEGLSAAEAAWAKELVVESLSDLGSSPRFHPPTAKAHMQATGAEETTASAIVVESRGVTTLLQVEDHRVREIRSTTEAGTTVRSIATYTEGANGGALPAAETKARFDPKGVSTALIQVSRTYTQVGGTSVPATVQENWVGAAGTVVRRVTFKGVELIQ